MSVACSSSSSSSQLMAKAIAVKHILLFSCPRSRPRPHPQLHTHFAISTNFRVSNHPASTRCKAPRNRTIVECTSDGRNNNTEENPTSLKDDLSSMVGEQVDEILNREENRDLLDGLEKASIRVQMAKRQLAQIEKQELEFKRFKDYINQLENRASQIAECQIEIMEARAKIEEAERSLSQNGEVYDTSSQRVEEERFESIKAACISAVVGTLAGMPIIFTQTQPTTISQFIFPVAITLISCALFGLTFRYTIRTDLDNIQLKTGTSAAFGIVKGLASLPHLPLELNTENLLSFGFDGAVYISENLYIFISAAVALDYCMKMRLLSPFPIKTPLSKDN